MNSLKRAATIAIRWSPGLSEPVIWSGKRGAIDASFGDSAGSSVGMAASVGSDAQDRLDKKLAAPHRAITMRHGPPALMDTAGRIQERESIG